MKRKIIFMFLSILLISFMFGKKIGTITDLINPYSLRVDNGKLYIVEGTSIYIYSLKGLKLENKFGKKGEGPEEFRVAPRTNMGNVNIEIYSDFILVNSLGKISFFSKDGEYQKEIRASGNWRSFKYLGDKFVGFGGFSREKNIQFIHLRIYDDLQKNGIDFFKQQVFFNQGNVNPFLFHGPNFYTVNGKIYVEKDKNRILVFDKIGNQISSIDVNKGYRKVLVTDKDRSKFLNYFKTHPSFKELYGRVKRDIKLNKYLPGIKLFLFADNKFYLIRWTSSDSKQDIAVFDLNGKLIKKAQTTFLMKDMMIPYAFTISNDLLYQLIENKDEEGNWDLFATPIK